MVGEYTAVGGGKINHLVFRRLLCSGLLRRAVWYKCKPVLLPPPSRQIRIPDPTASYPRRHAVLVAADRQLCTCVNLFLGPKRDEATAEWRRLRKEEFNYLYSSPNIIRAIKSRRMRSPGHVARMGGKRGAYWILVGRPEGRRPFGRPRRKWEDIMKMDPQEVGWGRGLD
jgi:hypothetical protein